MKQQNQFKKNPSFLRELVMFIRLNKKWYLIPIVISILLLGILIALGSTGAAPFIYTVFKLAADSFAQKVIVGALRSGFAARCEARLCLAVRL